MRIIDLPKVDRGCSQRDSQPNVRHFSICIDAINEVGIFKTVGRGVPGKFNTPMRGMAIGRLEISRPRRLDERVMRLQDKMGGMASREHLAKEMEVIKDIDQKIKCVVDRLNEIIWHLEAVGKKLTAKAGKPIGFSRGIRASIFYPALVCIF